MGSHISQDSVIVLGGSFNPPTLAHKTLITHALDVTDAGTGILVPSSNAYVTRKCARVGNRLVFTETERMYMLADLAKDDRRIQIKTIEFGDDGRGHTYRTMCRIQEFYAGQKCFFLMGADKLRIIPRWRDAERFLSEFGILAVARKGFDVRAAILSSPTLAAHGGSIAVIPAPEGADDVSSSLFQEKLLAHDPSARQLVSPYVYNLASMVMDGRMPLSKAPGKQKGSHP